VSDRNEQKSGSLNESLGHTATPARRRSTRCHASRCIARGKMPHFLLETNASVEMPCSKQDATLARWPSERDTTGLSRGVFTLVATQASLNTFWMPRPCAVELHVPSYIAASVKTPRDKLVASGTFCLKVQNRTWKQSVPSAVADG
jgi:hypothetical protein